jgi:hypothetical protein
MMISLYFQLILPRMHLLFELLSYIVVSLSHLKCIDCLSSSIFVMAGTITDSRMRIPHDDIVLFR